MLVILSMLLLFFWVWQQKLFEYKVKENIKNAKIEQKNLVSAWNDLEIWALENKRLYQDFTSAFLTKDSQFLVWNDLKQFVQSWANRIYKNIETWRNWWYLAWSKWIDFNITNLTNRVVISDWTEKLNAFTNNSYELAINSNITAIWNSDKEQFKKLLIRWWDPWSSNQPDIQVSLYRYKIWDFTSFDAWKILQEFYKHWVEIFYNKNFKKNIYKYSTSQNSNTISDEAYSANPQKDLFAKWVFINDIVSNEDFKPKEYLYYLVIESLSNKPLPVLIEAFNWDNERVWFVWDYTVTFDSFWLW